MLVTSFDFILHPDISIKSSCLRLTRRNATRRRLQCGRGDIPTRSHHDYSGHHCANFLTRVNLARIQYWLPVLVAKLFSSNRIHQPHTFQCLFGTSGPVFHMAILLGCFVPPRNRYADNSVGQIRARVALRIFGEARLRIRR